MSRLLYVIKKFKRFNDYTTYLIEMPYKDYLKDLQAEIGLDKELFPSTNYMRGLKNISKINKFIIKNNYVYFFAREDLRQFKLYDKGDDVDINNSDKIKTDKEFFSLLTLRYYSMKLSINEYINSRKEMLRLGEVHKNIFGGDENIIERIAIFHLNYYIYHKEQIEIGKLKLRDLFTGKYQKNIAIKYLSSENSNNEIIWDDRWGNLIVIELDNDYELEKIYLISSDKIRASKKKVSLFLTPVILEQHAIVYNKNEFIDLEEKYIKKFGNF